jgi:hypothetical protein
MDWARLTSLAIAMVSGSKLKGLRRKLRFKSAEVLVLVVFFFFSLRVINWFEYPYIMVSGDFRPPLVKEAFANRILYTWNEIDFGIPSVYSPRILDPFYFLTTVFQTLGVSLYLAQMVTVFLMYFVSSILMYLYVKQLTDGDIVASFIAALFVTANVHLISDREQTAIGFIDIVLMILPSLVTFTKGLNTRSLKWTAASGLLFLLTYGSFPNYRTTLLCGIALALTALFLFMSKGLKANYQAASHRLLKIGIDVDLLRAYLKHIFTIIASSLLASLWLIVLLITNLAGLFGLYKEMGAPLFVLNIQPHDVLRLITKWSFYTGALGQPYVPYRDSYTRDPLIVTLSYIPVAIAFASLLTSRSRKLTIYFGVVALLSLLLASGFNPYFSQLYFALATQVPLMLAFREPTSWIFLVVLSYSVLIGIAFSALYHKFKKRKFKSAALGFALVLFLSTTYPLVTGDVTRNWLMPSIKGSYFPPSYAELNNVLPSQYWTLLLPGRNTYVVYNFTEGLLSCGNPYPLVFSKPIISGVGTEYVQSENLELVNKLHELMVTNENVALEGKVSASSTEGVEFEPEKAVDGQFQTRWSSGKGVPQWFEVDWNQTQPIHEISIVFEAAYAEDYRVETWNDTSWVTQLIVKNNTSYVCTHSFPHPVATAKLRLYFTKTTEQFPSISIWELEVYARNPGISKLLGVLGIKYLVLEKNITLGNTYDIDLLDLNGSGNFVLAKEWDEVALYSNAFALQKLYVSDNTVSYETLEDVCKVAENSQWEILQHSVFVNSSSTDLTINNTLALPDDFLWMEHSPTSYEAHTESKGAFFLVFLESYDPNWRLYVNGSAVSEATHLKVNAFANGWLIDSTGSLTIRVEYETQSLFTISIVASIVLPAMLLVFLSRKELKKIIRLVRDGFRRRSPAT